MLALHYHCQLGRRFLIKSVGNFHLFKRHTFQPYGLKTFRLKVFSVRRRFEITTLRCRIVAISTLKRSQRLARGELTRGLEKLALNTEIFGVDDDKIHKEMACSKFRHVQWSHPFCRRFACRSHRTTRLHSRPLNHRCSRNELPFINGKIFPPDNQPLSARLVRAWSSAEISHRSSWEKQFPRYFGEDSEIVRMIHRTGWQDRFMFSTGDAPDCGRSEDKLKAFSVCRLI